MFKRKGQILQDKFIIGLLTLCLFFPIMGNSDLFAQANRTNSGDVTCPATGSSIQVLPFRNSRYSMLFNNISASAIRLGYLETGTANLSSSNSWLLQPGQATTDSTPGVLNRRVVCMSVTTAVIITFNETYR